MNGGLIATIVSLVSIVIAFLLGRRDVKSTEALRNEVAQSKTEARSNGIETASARVASEAVSRLFEAEAERRLTDADISQRLQYASTDEEVFKLAQIMAERAAERIERNKR